MNCYWIVSLDSISRFGIRKANHGILQFILKLNNSVVLDGVQLKGTYDQIDDGDGELVGFNGLTGPSAAGVLSLTSAGFLMIDSVGQIGIRFPGQ